MVYQVLIISAVDSIFAGFHSLTSNMLKKNPRHQALFMFGEYEGESASKTKIYEISVLKMPYRLMSNKAIHLKKQADIEQPQNVLINIEKTKKFCFRVLKKIISYLHVALNNTPNNIFSSPKNVRATSLRKIKAFSTAIRQLHKGLMNSIMRWSIQPAHTIAAKKPGDGSVFLNQYKTLSIMLSIATLSAVMLTIASSWWRVDTDTLGFQVNAADKTYKKMFSSKEENSLSSSTALSAQTEMQLHAGAANTDIEINIGNKDIRQPAIDFSVATMRKKVGQALIAFTLYMKETFAAENSGAVTIKPSKNGVHIEGDRKKEAAAHLKSETSRHYIDVLTDLTNGQSNVIVSVPTALISQKTMINWTQIETIKTVVKEEQE